MLAIASRTHRPEWASDLMHLLGIHGYFEHFEIYPGSKVEHFINLHQETTVAYEEMIFFDDEMRNLNEVARLGVKTVAVEEGINKNLVNQYLQIFDKNEDSFGA